MVTFTILLNHKKPTYDTPILVQNQMGLKIILVLEGVFLVEKGILT